MDNHREVDRDVRELRLEGVGLLVVGVLFLAAMVGAFFLGRWMERRATPEQGLTATMRDAGAGADIVEEPKDVGDDATYFDSVEGPEQEAEPRRQAAEAVPRDASDDENSAPVRPPATPEVPARAETAPAEAAGPFYAQVYALRDGSSAQKLLEALEQKGFRVRMDTEREGQGRLYKIRVGGFPTREEADAMAERLRGEGYPGAFVTRID